jgi:hypothetical protein
MSDSYDIFFAGKIADGFEESAVRAGVAKLFKANEQTLAKLFSGKPQLIKRGADKETALKYKAAMQKAGAVPVIRAVATAANSTKAAPDPQSAKADKAETMAERLARLTGETEPSADETTDKAAAAEAVPTPAAAAEAAPTPATAETGLTLAPAGSEVLRDEEREVVETLDIDTSAIELASNVDEVFPEATTPTPPAPDTSHLSMGEVGEDIPHIESEVVPLNPDVDHLSMGEVGEAIPHLESELVPVNPDTSGIELAPEGSDVLEEKYRQEETATPPDTDHLSLEQ